MASEKRCSYVMFGIGTFLLIFGIVIGFSWPYVFNSIRKDKLQLNTNSETYKLWIKTPLPIYLEIYLFNWTNSEEFMQDKKVKPRFEEVGPFVFEEVHERVNVVWNKNQSVTYNQTRKWTFLPNKSVDLNIPVTNLNVIATTITNIASTRKNILKVLVDFLSTVYKEKLIITRPASEWLFDGMEDKLLSFIKNFIPVPSDKFGWFYGRNGSSIFDGKFNVKTGEDTIFNLGMMSEWNGVNQTSFYEGECGVVRGSSGELLAPLGDLHKNLTLFLSDFCGTITLNYSGLTTVKGVEGYHFVGDKDVFDNGTHYPEGKCFCSGECSPSGVRNVTSCRQAPLFISYPHFYLADSVYTNSVIGMNPNKSKHEFYLSVDPLSGIPLEVNAQLQLNVLLRPLKQFHMFAEVPKIYVPMIWFRQRARVTSELISKSKELLLLELLGEGVGFGIAILFLLIIVIALLFIKYNSRKNNKPEVLINPEVEKQEEEEDHGSESER